MEAIGSLSQEIPKEERRVRHLALSLYETRCRLADDANYDWYQAERELGFFELTNSIAEVAAGFGEGRFGGDHSAISATISRAKTMARGLFEPIDVSLSEELARTLDRMERALAHEGNGQPSNKTGAGLRRFFSWLK